MLDRLRQLQTLQQELADSEQSRLELEQRSQENHRIAQSEIDTLRRAMVDQSNKQQQILHEQQSENDTLRRAMVNQSNELHEQQQTLHEQQQTLHEQECTINSLLAEINALKYTFHIFLLFFAFVAPPVAVGIRAKSRRMTKAETASALIRCTFLCFVLWFPAVMFAISFIGVRREEKKK
ncbi:hypothetical protein niasHT_036614 [Heterodera trifolii]|uniref:Uncharacterized protein n=1 Tax=Heterodera trifolii TaxID=157864 RepID=A0ABD2I2L2_9BILA